LIILAIFLDLRASAKSAVRFWPDVLMALRPLHPLR
jgi:hypothetical protein